LRSAEGEVRREDVQVLEAHAGRAYGRRLHRAGVKAAAQSAENLVFVAGVLGIPTSEEDALLMVAIPAGGYILVKIGGMALKRAVFLLRNSKNADEVVEGAYKLEFQVQRFEDAAALRTAVASENAALAERFDEVVVLVHHTDAVEVRSRAPPAVEIHSARNVEVRSQASSSTMVEMSNGPRTRKSLSIPILKRVNQREFSRWIRNSERRPARSSREFYRYQQEQAGTEEILVRGGGKEIWTDGVRMETARLVEVKFISSPETSPFILDSQCPPYVRDFVHADINDEFRRYAAIISDTNTPAVALEVIVNDARAVPYFEGLLRSWGIPGEILVRP